MQFPYVAVPAGAMGYVNMPYLPIRLSNGSQNLDELALLDSGSAISVLPFDIGLRLGLDWQAPMPAIPLGGLLAGNTAKGIAPGVQLGSYPAVQIAFAWSQSPDARLILGEVNFFSEFDVCFHRSRQFFEVKPKP